MHGTTKHRKGPQGPAARDYNEQLQGTSADSKGVDY